MKMTKYVVATAVAALIATLAHAGQFNWGRDAVGKSCAVVLKASDGFWNLRTSPNGKVIMRLHRGDLVEVVKEFGSWTRVAVQDSDLDGWIFTDAIQEIPCAN
jgi:SH3-like domain-containing protein